MPNQIMMSKPTRSYLVFEKKKTILSASVIGKNLPSFLCGFICLGAVHAQASVLPAGGDASGSGGSVAFSIGQVVYTTHSSGNGQMAQGVQHAYEIFSLGENELDGSPFSLSAFPNPAQGTLTLHWSEPSKDQKWMCELLDTQGKLIDHAVLEGTTHQFHLESYPTGTYFIYVINQENHLVHTFKIIKN
jgi:hypothetical protein